MSLILIGTNHKTAPIEIREQFFLSPTHQELFLSEIKCIPSVIECFCLSTCNRTEIYLSVLDGFEPFSTIIELFSQIKKIDYPENYKQYFYFLEDQNALKHLLRVSSGLDSLVLGEKQILGQLKKSLERARKKSLFLKQFNILENISVRTGKQAHTKTKISHGGSSVSWAAISKAEEIMGTLKNKSILVIGAGKMSELAVSQIQNKEINSIYFMNRTEAIADEFATKYDGISVGFCDIKEVLYEVDFCICAASAPHYVVERNMVEKVMLERNHKPLIFIDISMPRNIDPQVSQVTNVQLYSIDDLNQVVNENMEVREKATIEVEKIIHSQMSEFYKKISQSTDQPYFTSNQIVEESKESLDSAIK